MIRRLLVISALLLALPATAQAGWKVDRATNIAESVWGICPSQLEIRYANPATRGLPDFAAGWADEGACVIHLNPQHSMMNHWETFCTAVIHEAGHAATFRDWANVTDPQHSHQQGSVMSAQPTIEVTSYRKVLRSGKISQRHWSFDGTDRRCSKRGRPYLERHGNL